jgi:hypothetical protein
LASFSFKNNLSGNFDSTARVAHEIFNEAISFLPEQHNPQNRKKPKPSFIPFYFRNLHDSCFKKLLCM